MTNLFRRIIFPIACCVAISCTPKTPANGPVTVTPNVGSNGSLAFDPVGPYAVGTVVTLTATPANGYVVGQWTGTDDDASKSSINHLTITESTTSVSVTFVVASGGPFHLTLPVSTPNGTLTASPVEPQGGYTAGTVVALTAAPAQGFMLGAWTGTDNPSSTSLTNQVTMIADESVDVTFTGITYLLTVNTVGNVTRGTTTSVPTQTGPSYSPGTVVTLNVALGAAGHKVTWTGTDHDAQTGLTNTVTIGAAPATVTAAATCDTNCTLTINVDFPLDGFVTYADASQSLSGTSSGTQTQVQSLVGHTITVKAHDTPNWKFQGWGAPVIVTVAPCTGTVAMTVDQTVSASYPFATATAICNP